MTQPDPDAAGLSFGLQSDPLNLTLCQNRAVFPAGRFLGHGLLKIFAYLLNDGEGEEHVVAAAFHCTCP